MKINLTDLSNLQNEVTAVAAINGNNNIIEAAVENSISRDGTAPNQMNSDFDMNSNKILNLPNAVSDQEPVTYSQYLDGITAVSNGAVIDGDFVVMNHNATMLNDRVLTAGPNIEITDGGPKSTVVISAVDQVIPNYIAGLTLSTAGASTTFSLSPGSATDSLNEVTINLPIAMSKTTDAWAVGDAAGSLDTGVAAQGWYHVFLIRNPTLNTTDILISLSPTAPTLPVDFSKFRRIGSMYLNSSVQWRKFYQIGDEFTWTQREIDMNNVATVSTATEVVLSVPTGISVNALGYANLSYSSGSCGTVFTSLLEDDLVPGLNNSHLIVTASSVWGQTFVRLRTNTAAKVRHRSMNTGAVLYFQTSGWLDRRGQDG